MNVALTNKNNRHDLQLTPHNLQLTTYDLRLKCGHLNLEML